MSPLNEISKIMVNKRLKFRNVSGREKRVTDSHQVRVMVTSGGRKGSGTGLDKRVLGPRCVSQSLSVRG